MSKKKQIKSETLVSEYMNYIIENGIQPSSVYSFTKSIGINEKDFYNHYGSFSAIEKSVFVQFYKYTIDLLSKDENYKGYDSKSKLISFYFTIFELFKANRSYITLRLSKEKNILNNLNQLSELKIEFAAFIDNLSIDLPDFQIDKIEKYKNKGFAEILWSQFIFILKFWIEDESQNFEKTDILIEKSINTGFNLIETNPLQQVIDLGKFLIKEKTHFSF